MPTFRNYIDENKRKIIAFLEQEGDVYIPTWQIAHYYSGEREIYAVRKALKELESEGKVICKITGVNTKHWKLIKG